MEIAESIEATRQLVIRMFQVLERAALLIMLYSGKQYAATCQTGKVYLDDTNLMYALSSSADIGDIRETFFANQLKQNHQIAFSGREIFG